MDILLLLLLPIAGAIITAILGSSPKAKYVALASSLISSAYAICLVARFQPEAGTQFLVNQPWLTSMGINFKAGIDGISLLLVLLTNGLLPLIVLAGFKQYQSGTFYGLILFMQAGLLTVFTALDAFLFYVGWEAALIPIYFVCALWGGENRIKVNLKFFVYTIFGSLFMLLAIIYLHLQTPGKTFDIQDFYALNLDATTQSWIFRSTPGSRILIPKHPPLVPCCFRASC